MGYREMRLPEAAVGLTEETSVAIAQKIQWADVARSAGDAVGEVASGYVVMGERREGEAPLLLLHGFDSSLFEFRRLVPLLAEKRQVYVVDLLGFGFCDRASPVLQTQRPADTVNPDLIRQHLAAFCEQVIEAPVVLVGAAVWRLS